MDADGLSPGMYDCRPSDWNLDASGDLMEKSWIIVGFNHPSLRRSRVYRQDLDADTLHRALDDGIAKGCNVFSIRGFSQGDEVDPEVIRIPVSELQKLGICPAEVMDVLRKAAKKEGS